MSKRVVLTNRNRVVMFVRNEGQRIECWYIARPHDDPKEEGYAAVMHNGKREYVQRMWNERYKD